MGEQTITDSRGTVLVNVLYIASDQRDAGKTASCTTLAHELIQQGKRAAVFKPAPAADPSHTDPDTGIYQSLLGQSTTDWPFPPLDGDLTPKLAKEIRDSSAKIAQELDVLLIEEAPGVSKEASRQLVDTLDARVLVISRYRPDLHASDLSPWRELFGERILGFIVNGLTRHVGTSTTNGLLPSMSSEGLVSLGTIPEDRRLLGVTARQLVSDLDGRFIAGEDSADGLVEHLLVGGMGLDSGKLYFGLWEDKAVIVRGDRPDIQMAALGTPTSCLLLTQGIEPIEYVQYEAEQEQVPVAVVQSDTLTTMNSLNTVLGDARFDHPAKLDRFTELLRQHVDTASIYAGIGL